LFNRTILLQKL